MGTRALIHIKEGRTTIATIYRQMDGYEEGLGQEIVDILNKGSVKVVNGYGSGMKNSAGDFNGAGCLAAYLIGQLKLNAYGEEGKESIGNVYIMRPNTKDVGEEYTYTISVPDEGNTVNISVNAYNGRQIYKGSLWNYAVRLSDIKHGKKYG